MVIETITTYRPVMSQDLNHHGTLYAARTAEWFVEVGFIAAASITRPENIVCVKIYSMEFLRPVRKGEVLKLESKVVLVGRTSMVVYVHGSAGNEMAVKGFISFVNVDENGKPQLHGVTIIPDNETDLALQKEAEALRK